MSVLPSLIYRLSAVTIKISAVRFADIDKHILNFIWKDKRPRIINTVLKEKNKVEGLTLPEFKTYYKATVLKTLVLVKE